jgi:hypothetical protein
MEVNQKLLPDGGIHVSRRSREDAGAAELAALLLDGSGLHQTDSFR